jgi:hypothetical protein
MPQLAFERGHPVVSTSVYMIVFRVVHILAAVLWVGSAWLFTFFLEPALGSMGPAAGPFVEELVEKRKVPIAITIAATFTVLGGLFLYWHDWHLYGSLGDFVGSGFGLSLTVGAVAAIVAYLAGFFGIKPRAERMSALGKEMKAAGGPPSEAQQAEMRTIQDQMRMISRVDFVFLIVAVLGMATARIW